MNAPTDQGAFASQGTVAQACHSYDAASSRLLDAFFELELAVAKWLRHLGEDDTAKPLGQRLKQLVSHPQLADMATLKQRKRILALESASAESLKLRNAVVHSRRERHEIGMMGDRPCVFLTTINCALSGDHHYFVATFEELEGAALNASRLAGELANYLTQASSPPRPSPAAAAGP